MDSQKFSHVSIQDTHSIRLYLESLIAALENKEITLLSGHETIQMGVADLCRIAIQAKKKGSENKLSIKLSWSEDGAAPGFSPDEIEIK